LEERLFYLENDLVALHPAITRPLNEIKRLSQRCQVTGNGRAIRLVSGSGGGNGN
jgi:hypothetical protein